MMRRLVPRNPLFQGGPGLLECGHRTLWHDKVQRCYDCERERTRKNAQKR